MKAHPIGSIIGSVLLAIFGAWVAMAADQARLASKSPSTEQSNAPPAEMETGFECPDQMPTSLRVEAGRNFLLKLSALAPAMTVEQASNMRRAMLERHGCDLEILRLFSPTSLSRDRRPIASSLVDMKMAKEFYTYLRRGSAVAADRLLLSPDEISDPYAAAAVPAPRTAGDLSFAVDYIELGGEGAVHVAYHIDGSTGRKCRAVATLIFATTAAKHGIRTVYTNHGCATWTRFAA